MKKVFYLSSCSTCKKIMDQLDLSGFTLQDIKEQNISAQELEKFSQFSGGYEAIFSKRAMKYRGQGLHEKSLTEDDFKNLMLEEYTFLKRPFFLDGDFISVGNSKKVVDKLIERLGK